MLRYYGYEWVCLKNHKTYLPGFLKLGVPCKSCWPDGNYNALIYEIIFEYLPYIGQISMPNMWLKFFL